MSPKEKNETTCETVLINLFSENGAREKQIVVHRLPPNEAKSFIEECVGQGASFRYAATIFHPETEEPQIVVDSTFSPGIQEVYLEHERVQLEMIIGYKERTGFSIHGVLPKAHYAGLYAGVKLAKKLGILDEYTKIRQNIPLYMLN